MATTTTPAARFGWPGQTLEYTVRADGASEIVAPAATEKGIKVRVLDTRSVGTAVEARVAVDVSEGVLY